VLGLQLLNPILNRSTESIILHDAPDLNIKAERWKVERDLTIFPFTSSSYGVVLIYNSGTEALGMTVFAVSVIRGWYFLNTLFSKKNMYLVEIIFTKLRVLFQLRNKQLLTK
jgi:hypothetical protein